MSHDDLLQQALLGLWQAALSFDPLAGVQFKTYAKKRIVWAMYDGIDLWRYGRKPRQQLVLDHSALARLSPQASFSAAEASDLEAES